MNKYMKKILSAIWAVEIVLSCLVMIICFITFFDLYSFEYYGYNQWPWIYDNKVIHFRYVFSEILICTLGVGYSYRYLKQNLIKALLIMTVSTILTLYLFIF